MIENKVNLYGASGHCKVIIDILMSNDTFIDSIIDDNPNVKEILNYKVLKNSDINFDLKSDWIISIGNNKIRKIIAQKFHLTYTKAIHNQTIISPFSEIGFGTVVMAGVIINPDVTIGKHCIINTGAVIEHDCHIEDYVHISPSVALVGGVTVKEGSHIGIGAYIIQGIKIGKWVTIGAGAVIVKDVPDYATVVGATSLP